MFFKTASRLGDGVIWYALMLALPFLYGERGLEVALVMLATSAAGLAVYKLLKRTFVRERPFIRHAGISLAGAPLDRYSFPSGHTLHAVAFTWQAVRGVSRSSAVVLVPLALAIAASRVVLGLHYPTDVLVGALLGAASGVASARLRSDLTHAGTLRLRRLFPARQRRLHFDPHLSRRPRAARASKHCW